MSEEKMKQCKYCKMEIPAKAKVCPHCRKKQKGGKLKWIVLAAFVLLVLGIALGGKKDSDTKTTSAGKNQSQDAETEELVEYTAYTVGEMIKDLDENAMGASDKYKNQYIEITGVLSTIDSDGKYILLDPTDGFSMYNVQCYIKDEEQKKAVSQMKKGDSVTLRGKCTGVGEVLGYSLNIDSIG